MKYDLPDVSIAKIVSKIIEGLAPYTVETIIREADKSIVITLFFEASKISRVISYDRLANDLLRDYVIKDFKRDIVTELDKENPGRIELFQRLGSRNLSSFNPNLKN